MAKKLKVVIVGGSAGGATCAARLRRLNEDAEIIMLEKGEYISYANCGLPYYVGNVIKEKDSLLIQTPEEISAKYNLDVRTKQEAIEINRSKKYVVINDLTNNKQYKETYDYLVLATGSTPFRPNIKGIESKRILTLWNVPDSVAMKQLAEKSKSATVLGGGFIGLEVAENLLERGLKVNIADASNQILGPMDIEMAKILENQIHANGVNLYLGDGVDYFEEVGNTVKTYLKSGRILESDMVVLSIGIRPNTKIAKEAGLTLTDRGFIEVDKNMRSSDQSIFAVGDIAHYDEIILNTRTTLQLAGPANREARIAADNIAGIASTFAGTQGSSVARIFGLTAASTGLNEKVLINNGLVKDKDYKSIIITPNNHPGYMPYVASMFVKLIFSSDGKKIYGAQVVGGEGADKRLDVIATAIKLNGSVNDLAELELGYSPIYSSPKDPVNMAGFVAQNVINGIISFADYYVDSKDKILLDVREDVERLAYEIPHATAIPLGQLRANLSKLDKNKEIIVFCAVGVRAYNGARILMQKGFTNVKVYPGGVKLYRLLNEENKGTENMNDNNEVIKDNGTAVNSNVNTIELDCCGLQCPGPLMRLYETIKLMDVGEQVHVTATDQGFPVDAESWCKRTGNLLINKSVEGTKYSVTIQKGNMCLTKPVVEKDTPDGKTIIVFSGDFDKVMASFIIANGAAAMGRKVTMFFTFWGLTALRRKDKVKVKKTFMEKMFGWMLPRGVTKLGLSRMNMGGLGTKMMKKIMKDKNVESLESLVQKAMNNGVHIMACSMSMDVMGIHKEELIDGVEVVGVGTYLGNAEESNVNLFM